MMWAGAATAVLIAVSVATGTLGALWYAVWLGGLCALVLWDPLNAVRIFIVLTPVHTVGMILIYGLVGHPGSLMTLFQAWKELVLAWTAFVLFLLLDRGGVLLRPAWADRFAILYLLLAVVYVAVPGLAGDPGDLGARLYGFRESVLPPLLYLLGRVVPSDWVKIGRVLRLLVAASVVWCLVAVVEVFYDPGDLLRAIGYTQFQTEVLQAGGELNPEGLAYTYTTSAGIRRVGSVFLHPLGFAIALLFVLPLLASRAMDRSRGYGAALFLALAALFATLSRGPLVMFVFSLVMVLWWRGGVSLRALAWAGLAALAVSVPFATVGMLKQYLADTLAVRDASTIARLANVTARLATLAEHPWLGTGVSSATREGDIGGAESEMLQLALRFGVVGLSVYLALVASLLRAFWRRRQSAHRAEFIWAGVSLLSLNLYGLVNPLWRSGFHTLVIWFAWGLMATQALADAREASAPSRAAA